MEELVSCVDDLLIKMNPWFTEQDNAKKVETTTPCENHLIQVEIFRSLCETEIVPFLSRFEGLLTENDTGYFVGDKVWGNHYEAMTQFQLSYADLAIFHIFWFMNHKILPGALRKYAKLDEFVTRISDIPNIKKWIETRPKTEA